MSEPVKKQRVAVSGEITLAWPRHVKFRFDAVRDAWIVLAPEKLILPDAQTVEILKLIDGEKTVDAIVDDLAQRFNAPRDLIASDVIALFQDFADKGVLSS